MHGQHKVLQTWLKDAHAMERSAVDNLERQLRRLEGHPELRAKFAEHLQRTRGRAAWLETCLRRNGAEPSALKDTTTRFAGMAEAWLAGVAPDEAVKQCLATYAARHFALASYTALAAAAEACGEDELKRRCEEIADEERTFAEWLCAYIPEASRRHCQQEGAREQQGTMADFGHTIRRNPVPTAALAVAGLGAMAAAAYGARRLFGGGAIGSLQDLYVSELQELRSSEHRMESLLGRLAEGARDGALRSIFAEHCAASRMHCRRLEEMIRSRRRDAFAHTDQAMDALVRETEKMLAQLKGAALAEAGLIASVQMIAHYQIAAYGSAAAWAGKLGYEQHKGFLHDAVVEKKRLDEALSQLAEQSINPQAAAA